MFSGKRGYFLKREHRGIVWALASKLGMEDYVEFGYVETGRRRRRQWRESSQTRSIFPLCIPELSLRSDTLQMFSKSLVLMVLLS